MSRSAVLVDNTTLLSLGAKQNCGFILERSVAQDPAVCWQLFFFFFVEVLVLLALIKL